MPFLTVCLFTPLLTRLGTHCLAEPTGTTSVRVEITWSYDITAHY